MYNYKILIENFMVISLLDNKRISVIFYFYDKTTEDTMIVRYNAKYCVLVNKIFVSLIHYIIKGLLILNSQKQTHRNKLKKKLSYKNITMGE